MYRKIFSTIRDAVMLFDAHTRELIEVNKACEKLYGYTREMFLKLKHSDITAEPEKSEETIKAVINGEIGTIPVRYHRKKDGTVFPVEITGSFFAHNGRDVVCGVIRDISKRKRAENALKESEERFRALVEQIPNAIIYVAALDENSTTLYVSPQIEDILGYTQEEFKADPDIWAKRIHPDDHDRVMTEVARCHRTQEQLSVAYRMIRKDGRLIWFHDEARIVRDDNGNPLYLLGVNKDVTYQKSTEEELKNSRDNLERQVEERTVELTKAVEKLRREIKERKETERQLREREAELHIGTNELEELNSALKF